MSFKVFKDFDKAPADLINDDFDSKFTLKIKTAGPSGTTITTNSQYVDKDNKQALMPKVSLKWPHPSGFTLEKLELSPDCKMTVETSLSGVAPGLKVEFKGNDGEKADLSVTYTAPVATVTGDFDINNFSRAEASVSAGSGPVTGGASAKFTQTKDENGSKLNVSLGLGVAHTVPGVCYAALRAKDNFSAYGLLWSYSHFPQTEIAGSIDYSSKGTSGCVVGSYAVDPATTMKLKATSQGIFAASMKKNFEKKFSVVGSVEVPSNLKSLKWGLNATLG
mmetsp:Transcript_38909/g.107168  ORF Transcript_38909/g.107168 Transcript_38909/m.107168 type:complete len:278 (+) Transcript_38909:44-877(+)|eukprot:CAMPEP_0117524300 /NCGR_PEP_ID=MMETSP0784-20121206/35174_1 /TAXON_ID=39447 /ORGANISM="" /LENGTH=277 /DNA_ID=CAMNT_0005320443 /DNA_START=36 /DNA_END=869 /DNA_ORIENTATION=-